MDDLQRALNLARQDKVAPSAFEHVRARSLQALEAQARAEPRRLWGIRALFGLSAAVWVLLAWVPNAIEMSLAQMLIMIVPIATAIVGALAARGRDLRSALIVLACATSQLFVATLLALSTSLGPASLLIVGAMIGVLGIMGVRKLDGETDSFQPVRFRGLIVAAMVFAASDALSLMFTSSLRLLATFASWKAGLGVGELATGGVVAGVAGVVMLVNVWGLLRLRTWALISNVLTNLLVAGLAMRGWVGANELVQWAFVGTAVLQLFLVVPIVAAAFGAPPRPPVPEGAVKRRLAYVLAGLVALLVVEQLVPLNLSARGSFGLAGWTFDDSEGNRAQHRGVSPRQPR